MILKVALLQILPGNGLTEQFHIGEEALRRAKDAGADLALFPEMWSTGYEIPPDEDVLGRMAVSADGNFIKKFGWLAKNLEMAIGITFLEKHSPRKTPLPFMTDMGRGNFFIRRYIHVNSGMRGCCLRETIFM